MRSRGEEPKWKLGTDSYCNVDAKSARTRRCVYVTYFRYYASQTSFRRTARTKSSPLLRGPTVRANVFGRFVRGSRTVSVGRSSPSEFAYFSTDTTDRSPCDVHWATFQLPAVFLVRAAVAKVTTTIVFAPYEKVIFHATNEFIPIDVKMAAFSTGSRGKPYASALRRLSERRRSLRLKLEPRQRMPIAGYRLLG